MTVGYADAYEIISRMEGPCVPKEWQGGLNVTYRMGPTLAYGTSVRISVKAETLKKPIKNIIGYIKGSEQPDKYVLVGNHHDAWVYGSVDPMSGTAVQAEMARALVQTMKETGWRPRRSIMFCNWDAEEFGLLGSTEFVEDFTNVLQDRAIVYLNVDNIHANGSLHVSTIPSIYQVAYETAKLVTNPMDDEIAAGRKTVYDTWKHYYPGSYSYLPDAPSMPIPGVNSDHAPFLNYLGLPVTHMSYQGKNTYLYPLYHTMYETSFLNEHLFDTKNLSVHRAVGQYWALLAYRFADSSIVPLNVTVFAAAMSTDYVQNLKNKVESIAAVDHEAHDAGQQVMYLCRDAKNLLSAAVEFEKLTQENMEPMGVNDRIMAVHKCFVNPRGLPGQPSMRNLIYSMSEKISNTSNVFSVIYGIIEEFEKADNKTLKIRSGRELAYQISILQYSIKCAVNSLNDRI